MLLFNHIKGDDRALRILFFAVIAGLVVLAGGLWWVQVVNGREYQSRFESQSFRSVRVAAPRGRILDRNGIELANNRPSYDVSFYLEEMRKPINAEFDARVKFSTNALRIQREAKQKALGRSLTKDEAKPFRLSKEQRDEIAQQSRLAVANNFTASLAQKLQMPLALDAKKFAKHYLISRSQPFVVVTNLQPQQIARFEEQFGGAPGVELAMRSVRYYPATTTAAHLLGYGSSQREGDSMAGEQAFYDYRLPDFHGLIGVEGGLDEELRGQPGEKSVQINYLGYKQSETILQPTVPGSSAVLTVDVRIQKAAEKALSHSSEGVSHRGAIVVMDTRNGDVLAMASSPTFNPNYWASGFPPGELERLNDPQSKPQRNRATQDNYQPGSVFKIIVAMAALELGHNPDAIYTVPADSNGKGMAVFGRNQTKQDQAPPGPYNFIRAFIKSSNGYFIHAGLEPGVLEKVVELGGRLHFGERADLPTRQESAGVFPKPDNLRAGWSLGATANLSIGQEKVETTPMQVAVMISAVANGGKVFWPRLVQRLDFQDPLATGPGQKFEEGRVRDTLGVSAKTMQLVRTAMFADVEDSTGSGEKAFVPGFRIGGKTGTAQVGNERNRVIDHITWFASFGGPASEATPRYAVVVMVESGTSGGTTCAPLAKEVYQAIQNLNAPPTVARAN